MNQRKRIIDHARSKTYISFDQFKADSKAEFLAFINELVKDMSDDAKFEVEADFEGYHCMNITTFRDETDAEMNNRLTRTKNRRFRDKEYRQKRAAEQKQEAMRELNRLAAKQGFKLVPNQKSKA